MQTSATIKMTILYIFAVDYKLCAQVRSQVRGVESLPINSLPAGREFDSMTSQSREGRGFESWSVERRV
jgi:hypothetical protein